MIYYLLFAAYITLSYNPPPLYPLISLEKTIYLTLNPLLCNEKPEEEITLTGEQKQILTGISFGSGTSLNYIYSE